MKFTIFIHFIFFSSESENSISHPSLSCLLVSAFSRKKRKKNLFHFWSKRKKNFSLLFRFLFIYLYFVPFLPSVNSRFFFRLLLLLLSYKLDQFFWFSSSTLLFLMFDMFGCSDFFFYTFNWETKFSCPELYLKCFVSFSQFFLW